MRSFKLFISEAFSNKEAQQLGDKVAIDWTTISLAEFKRGLEVEQEHNRRNKLDVVSSKLDLAKIAASHLKENPQYYTNLKQVEEDAPANSSGGGGIAGLLEPLIVRRKKRTK